LCSHQCREHFDLRRGNFGEKAHTVAHAALVRFENVEHVAYQVEGALLNPISTKNDLLRIDPVGDGKCRLLNKISYCLSRQRLASPIFTVKLQELQCRKKSMQLIRVFVSSPGDAENERKKVS